MKIKRKVEMNLPQLIEYAWDNEIENKEYPCDGFEDKTVIFNGVGWAEFSDEFSYNPHDTFTIEIEEVVTEDTVIDKMLVKFKNPDTYGRFKNDSINGFEIEEGNIEAFYIVNDDKTLTLIWTNEKGLVE